LLIVIEAGEEQRLFIGRDRAVVIAAVQVERTYLKCPWLSFRYDMVGRAEPDLSTGHATLGILMMEGDLSVLQGFGRREVAA
jgi:hypothetical protein